MKKLLFAILFLILFLTGCNNKSSSDEYIIIGKKMETISTIYVTTDNISEANNLIKYYLIIDKDKETFVEVTKEEYDRYSVGDKYILNNVKITSKSTFNFNMVNNPILI